MKNNINGNIDSFDNKNIKTKKSYSSSIQLAKATVNNNNNNLSEENSNEKNNKNNNKKKLDFKNDEKEEPLNNKKDKNNEINKNIIKDFFIKKKMN